MDFDFYQVRDIEGQVKASLEHLAHVENESETAIKIAMLKDLVKLQSVQLVLLCNAYIDCPAQYILYMEKVHAYISSYRFYLMDTCDDLLSTCKEYAKELEEKKTQSHESEK